MRVCVEIIFDDFGIWRDARRDLREESALGATCSSPHLIYRPAASAAAAVGGEKPADATT